MSNEFHPRPEYKKSRRHVENAWFLDIDKCAFNRLANYPKIEDQTLGAISQRLNAGDVMILTSQQPTTWLSFNLMRPLANLANRNPAILRNAFIISLQDRARHTMNYGRIRWNLTYEKIPRSNKFGAEDALRLLCNNKIDTTTFNVITSNEQGIESAREIKESGQKTEIFMVGVHEWLADDIAAAGVFDNGTRVILSPPSPTRIPHSKSVSEHHLEQIQRFRS